MDILKEAKTVLEVESQAILDLIPRLSKHFEQAVQLIVGCKGKVVVTGIGKSGHIGRKIASTLSSTGTVAVFMHAAESSHGDLGMVTEADVVMAISYGGEAQELAEVYRYCGRKGIPIIGVTGKIPSTLSESSTVVLDISVKSEACPLGLAPTASSTAAIAMGDALAMTVMTLRGFKPEEFAEFHPGGSLGYKLLTKVKDVMHTGDSIPTVKPETSVKEVLGIMTHKDVRGAAGIVSDAGDLMGVITDGDIRRRLEKNQDPLQGVAKDLMSLNPRTIDMNELAEKALFMMEQFRIQMVFVLDKSSAQPMKPVGILHIQDLLKTKLR